MNCDKCALRLIEAARQAADNVNIAQEALQQAAVDALDEGVKVDAIAEAIGVNRATIYRWRRQAP